MSVQPSFRPPGISRLSLDEFSWSLLFENFSKIWREMQVLLKYGKINENVTWRPTGIYDNILVNSYQNEKFFRQKFRTHILFSTNIFRNLCPLWDYVKKYSGTKKAMDDNTTRRRRGELCMQDNKGYRHRPRICNTYWNSSRKFVTWKHLSGTLTSALLSFTVMC